MQINSNYSIDRLFVDKKIKIFCDNQYFTMNLFTIKDMFENDEWNAVYHMWTLPLAEMTKLVLHPVKESFELIQSVCFDLGMYTEFRKIDHSFQTQMQKLFPELEIDRVNKEIKINDVIITSEIWEYILYILKLSNGEKVEKPLTFESEEARQFYLAQKANEERIARLRAKDKKNATGDSLSKILLSITYAFPGLTVDYLINQTMAQIQWLQKYAAGSVSYEVNAQAFAAGNMKKGSKLDFFIK